ncbi:hypothetical protein OG802_12255 [Streptomyces sp. NBC_00704]|uniref:hypothetical protein n=1 Tax=Streptomyces sp. NBC_00704 TaxID=2975809 RepID=UPI002E37B9B3|nr:hypothetical protein [Streptomyces sp. NBC_00704]
MSLHRPAPTGIGLYARSRALPVTLALLAVTCAFAVGAAHRAGQAHPAAGWSAQVVALAPLSAAALIGASLYAPSDELDRTAVRPWWLRRLVHLLALSALACVPPALAVPGDGPALVAAVSLRNLLGCVGVTAVAAVVVGARLSWLPAFCYLGAVHLASRGVHGWGVTVWAWPTRPGQEAGAWLAAGAVFVVGTALHVIRGSRPEGTRA